jgi:hypothetical protein
LGCIHTLDWCDDSADGWDGDGEVDDDSKHERGYGSKRMEIAADEHKCEPKEDICGAPSEPPSKNMALSSHLCSFAMNPNTPIPIIACINDFAGYASAKRTISTESLRSHTHPYRMRRIVKGGVEDEAVLESLVVVCIEDAEVDIHTDKEHACEPSKPA